MTIYYRIFNRIRNILRNIIWFRKFIIFKASVGVFDHDLSRKDCYLTSYEKFGPEFINAIKKSGRSCNLDLLESRFSNNLLFYILSDRNGSFLASVWVHPTGQRFIDEIGYMVDVGEDSIWFRDGFVSSKHRGKRILPQFHGMIIAKDYIDKTYAWSDVSSSNLISIKAHKNLKYEKQCVIRALFIFKIIVLRQLPTDSELEITGYQVDNPLLVHNKEYETYKQKRYS